MPSFSDALRSNHVPMPRLSALEARLETQWRALTEAANKAFEHHDDSAARLYDEALDIAVQVFDAVLENGSPLLAPMIYNISCANAAECASRRGDLLGSRQLLIRASEQLLTAAESASSPLALRINCMRHLRYPFQILARDFGAEDTQPDIRRLLERCSKVSNDVQCVANWLLQPQCSPDGPVTMAGPTFAAGLH